MRMFKRNYALLNAYTKNVRMAKSRVNRKHIYAYVSAYAWPLLVVELCQSIRA